MARLFTAGMEMRSFDANGVVELSAGGTTLAAVETGTVRSGSASVKCAGGANTSFAVATWTGATTRTYYARFYFRLDAYPTVATPVIAYMMTSTNGLLTGFRVTSSGVIQLWRELATAAKIGSDGPTLNLNQWYMLELATKVVGSGSTDYVEGRVDGTSFASTTTQTLGATPPSRLRLGFPVAPTATANAYIDDVAINNDSVGGTQTSWPGSGKIVALFPISDNAIGGWKTASTGGTTNLWDALNNTPPVGAAPPGSATSQITNTVSSATSNYDGNCTDYTTAGITAADTIKVVQPFAAAGPESAVAIARSIGVVSNPAISDVNGTAATTIVGAYPTGWNLWAGGIAYDPSVTLGTSPVLRVGKRTATVSALDCCSAGIYVDYTPGVPFVGPPKPKMVNQAINRAASY